MSYLQIVLVGVFVIFLLIFFRELDWQQVSNWPVIKLGWGLFLVALIVSSIGSVNRPLSLDYLVFYLFAGLLFHF